MVKAKQLQHNVDEWRRRHNLPPAFERPQDEFTIHLVIPESVVNAVGKHEARKAAARKAAATRKAKRVSK